MSEEVTPRPFVFTVIEDDGENVVIEVSEEDYRRDLEAGMTEDETLKPGRYKMRRGGFHARHPEFKPRRESAPGGKSQVRGSSDEEDSETEAALDGRAS
jgi:hypothetical protein